MIAATDLRDRVGTTKACAALGVPRASFYRSRLPRAIRASSRRTKPARALTPPQRDRVLEVLNSERFADTAPTEVFATLLDEGDYLCSTRSMYRILAASGEVRERRDQLRHPEYTKPELLAIRPNQVWSWDITKLLGPAKWTYYYLYVILDIYSRLVTGWMIALRESATLAKQLIGQSAQKFAIAPGQLTIHADRGSSMSSKAVAFLMADLGITKTHSRPHVSNDNPYSEAQFKTMKYRPDFPDRFGSLEDARAFCIEFFDWYNHAHRHAGLNLYTPASVHFGQHEHARRTRQATMDLAYARNPERFVGGAPVVHGPPTEAWINPPSPDFRKPTSLAAPGDVIVDRVDPGCPPDSWSDDSTVRLADEHEVSTLACARSAQ